MISPARFATVAVACLAAWCATPACNAPSVEVEAEASGSGAAGGAGGAGGVGGAGSGEGGAPPLCGPGSIECAGVCVDLDFDPANCGACGNSCPSGEVCSMGECGLVCLGGTTKCDASCVDTASNPAHCGMCGNACPSVPNASSVCAQGTCAFVCAPAHGDCNALAADGCEASFSVDANHCGGCGKVCASKCVKGACVTPKSCKEVEGPSGIYTIDPDGDGGADPFDVRCEMTTDGGGWTLIASFVNTDGNLHWTRPVGDARWRDQQVFGAPATHQAADHKSAAWFSLAAKDILVADANGFVSFDGVLANKTMRDVVLGYNTCQKVPLVGPGSPVVDSSSAFYKNSAMLAFYAGDPNSGDQCTNGGHNDSTILAIGGHGCGTIGMGQWGTNYSSGLDWHANLDNATACTGCDQCGGWYGFNVVTSNQHSNNSGIHDASSWGALYVR